MPTVEGEETSGISVVIPCLDEEEAIADVVDAARAGITETGLPGEVIVVDNGSTDRSGHIAREHGAIVVAEDERGYGAALRKGFAEARYSILVMGDGDSSYDLSKLKDMVEPILEDKADFVVGNRMTNIQPNAMPRLHRYIGNPVLSMVLRVMFNVKHVRDMHCGMRAISRTAYRNLHCITTGMEFASEMIARAVDNHLRMEEQDIIYYERSGTSKLDTLTDGFRHVRFMLLYAPLTLWLLPGLFLWLLSIVFMLPIPFGRVVEQAQHLSNRILIGGMLNALSLPVIAMAIIVKAYADRSGLHKEPTMSWLYSKLTYERLMLISMPLIIGGLALLVVLTVQRLSGGLATVSGSLLLFFGMLCLVNGVQLVFGGYVLSVMTVPRHLEPYSPVSDDRTGGTQT